MSTTTIKTAAAYIRVSTDRQEELSPDAQRRELKNYAKKNGIMITDIFEDSGISGRNAEKRPAFQKMISYAKSKEHPYDYILVWKFSRFARNQEESIVYKSLLQKNGVEVVSITEPLIDGPFASLIERIIEWMDEYYSIRLASDVKRGMEEKALRGGYQAAPPLGYHMVNHVPAIYEPEAVIVREIYRLAAEGKTSTTIARIINDAGYRTRRGKPFEHRGIVYILQNPFYKGYVRWNYRKHSSYHNNTDSDIITTKGLHKPLIDEDHWTQVQKIVPFVPGSTGQRRRKSSTLFNHYLSGIMRCPACGANLSFHTNKKNTSFVCWRYSKGMHANTGSIVAWRCEEALVDSLRKTIDTTSTDMTFHAAFPDTPPASDMLKQYQDSLAKLEQKEQRIRDAYIEGIDTKEEYKENKFRIAEERDHLKKLIKKEERRCTPHTTAINGTTYISMIKNLLDTLEDESVDVAEKHEAVAQIIDHIEYHRDNDTFNIFYSYS